MNKTNITITAIIIVLVVILLGNPFYVLYENQQAIITMFGKARGNPITTAGLKLKVPFLEKVYRFEKRILEWDGYPSEIPTKDKRYIWVDTTARWKIVDALKYFKSVSNETGAHAILDGIIDAVVRDAITSQDLIEIVRSSNRIAENREQLIKEEEFIDEGALENINIGRDKIQTKILQGATKDLGSQYGIELIDVRIKRVNYVEQVRSKVYERMIAERRRAAEKYRSEGRGVRADIEGRTDKELKVILSEAYKKSQIIKGEADATAAKIYADAYSQDSEFFSFLKTLETYGTTIDENTTVILTTEADYFKYLKQISP